MNGANKIETTNIAIELLSKVMIFSETSHEVLEEIAAELKEIKVRKGQNIFKKGEEGDAMFIIKSGSVRVHDGNHVLSRLHPGQVFGEFALFDREVRSASVTADETTVLFELGQDEFARVMTGKVDVTLGVLRKVIRRIREMNELEGKLAKSYMKIQKQKSEIEEQHLQLIKQKEELEKTNQKLSQLNEEKNRLISVVSHGFRNPLTSSLCVMDLIDLDPQNFSQEQLEYFELVHSSLRRMNSLINQTLDIDVIELQRDKLRLEILRLDELIKQASEGFKYTLQIKKLKVDLKLEPLMVSVDKNFFYLIFDNLLSNAIKFSPSSKQIYIDLFEKGETAIIEISDEGPGMTDEALKTLFDNPKIHGRQADKTGLSIAKKYIEAMGGEISCTSRPGSGTTFSVSFKNIKK